MSDEVDPNKRAIGLKYESGSAPKVVAKGYGSLAQELIAIAQENDVMIHQDEELSKFLHQLDIGQEIPKELYIIIAELIAFAFVLQGKFPDKWKNVHNKIDIKSPLLITISIFSDRVEVKNNCNKKQVDNSNGVGLENLNKRIKMLTNKTLIITETFEEFIVYVPLINKAGSKEANV